MKTLVKRTVTFETKAHNYPNGWSYVEIWRNAKLIDQYFVETQYMFKNGEIKNGGRKYFYSSTPDNPEKIIKPFNWAKFKYFELLFYYDNDGCVLDINNNIILD